MNGAIAVLVVVGAVTVESVEDDVGAPKENMPATVAAAVVAVAEAVVVAGTMLAAGAPKVNGSAELFIIPPPPAVVVVAVVWCVSLELNAIPSLKSLGLFLDVVVGEGGGRPGV